LESGSTELSADLATHCVLELPKNTGDIPSSSLDIEDVSDDETRLLYQPLNGGKEIVFNVLQNQNVKLNSWTRFHVSS
jgi:hypothetical protein